MDKINQQAGLPGADHPLQQQWLERRIQHQMGMQLLEQLLAQLPELLKQSGMSQEAIDELMEGMEANREALADQIAQQVGESIARQRAEQHQQQKQDSVDLMDRPFKNLSEQESQLLRDQVRRLAAQLRSRAALRQKRGKSGFNPPAHTIALDRAWRNFFRDDHRQFGSVIATIPTWQNFRAKTNTI